MSGGFKIEPLTFRKGKRAIEVYPNGFVFAYDKDRAHGLVLLTNESEAFDRLWEFIIENWGRTR